MLGVKLEDTEVEGVTLLVGVVLGLTLVDGVVDGVTLLLGVVDGVGLGQKTLLNCAELATGIKANER